MLTTVFTIVGISALMILLAAGMSAFVLLMHKVIWDEE